MSNPWNRQTPWNMPKNTCSSGIISPRQPTRRVYKNRIWIEKHKTFLPDPPSCAQHYNIIVLFRIGLSLSLSLGHLLPLARPSTRPLAPVDKVVLLKLVLPQVVRPVLVCGLAPRVRTPIPLGRLGRVLELLVLCHAAVEPARIALGPVAADFAARVGLELLLLCLLLDRWGRGGWRRCFCLRYVVVFGGGGSGGRGGGGATCGPA